MLIQVKKGEVVQVPVVLVDIDDGYTPETEITTPFIFISKNGAAADTPNDGTWTNQNQARLPGQYNLQLDDTDTDTVGRIQGTVWKDEVTRHFDFVIEVTEHTLDDIYALLADVKTQLDEIQASVGDVGSEVWEEIIAEHASVAGSAAEYMTVASQKTAESYEEGTFTIFKPDNETVFVEHDIENHHRTPRP